METLIAESLAKIKPTDPLRTPLTRFLTFSRCLLLDCLGLGLIVLRDLIWLPI